MLKNSFKDKKVVLVGGCFDILHPGHIIFLEKAKREGNYLIVLLESDEKVRKLKGEGRPIHIQKDRAMILSAIRFVDLVIPIPFLEKEGEYDELIAKISPDIISVTEGSSDIEYKIRSAKAVGAKLKYVTKMVEGHSTSKILNNKSIKSPATRIFEATHKDNSITRRIKVQ